MDSEIVIKFQFKTAPPFLIQIPVTSMGDKGGKMVGIEEFYATSRVASNGVPPANFIVIKSDSASFFDNNQARTPVIAHVPINTMTVIPSFPAGSAPTTFTTYFLQDPTPEYIYVGHTQSIVIDLANDLEQALISGELSSGYMVLRVLPVNPDWGK